MSYHRPSSPTSWIHIHSALTSVVDANSTSIDGQLKEQAAETRRCTEVLAVHHNFLDGLLCLFSASEQTWNILWQKSSKCQPYKLCILPVPFAYMSALIATSVFMAKAGLQQWEDWREKTLHSMKLKSATVECSWLFEVVDGKYCLKQYQLRWTFGSEGSLVSTVSSTREGRSLSTHFAVCSWLHGRNAISWWELHMIRDPSFLDLLESAKLFWHSLQSYAMPPWEEGLPCSWGRPSRVEKTSPSFGLSRKKQNCGCLFALPVFWTTVQNSIMLGATPCLSIVWLIDIPLWWNVVLCCCWGGKVLFVFCWFCRCNCCSPRFATICPVKELMPYTGWFHACAI